MGFFNKITDIWHQIDPIAAKSTDYLVSKTMSHNERIAGDLGLEKLQQMAKYYENNPRAAESQAAPIVLATLATVFSGGSASPALASELEAAQAADTAAGLMTAEDLAVINQGTGLAGDAATLGSGVDASGVVTGNADKAAIYGPEGYGPGMTGGETAAYDAGLGTAAGSAAGAATKTGGAMADSSWVDSLLKYGAPIASALIQKNAGDKATEAQTTAANNALQFQKDQAAQVRSDTEKWRLAGQASIDKLMGLMNSGELTSKFAGMNPLEERGYQFAASEGQKAINNRAGGIGGDVLKASTRFAEDNATKYYNDAFNRFQTEKTNTVNPLMQLAGLGTTGNQQAMVSGSNAADKGGNALLFGGVAQGQGNLAQGNIYSNLLNQLSAQYLQPPPKSPG